MHNDLLNDKSDEITRNSTYFKHYHEYKQSDVEWLGEIPRYWGVRQLKYLSTIKTGSTPSMLEEDNYTGGEFPWVKPDDLNSFEPIYDSKEHLSKKGMNEVPIIPPFSVLVCCIGSIGKLGISGVNLATNQQINSIIFTRKSDWLPEFGKYALFASKQEHEKRASSSVVAIVNRSSQERIKFPVPPVTEQKLIAKFLDQETERIDQLIEKQERLIELLEEKRTALISHAVTKGLDPNVEMKDSGVEWLGEIPKHWDLPRVWMLFDIGRGRVISNIEIQENPGSYPVYSSQTENDGVLGKIDTYDFEGKYLTWTTDGAKAGTVFSRTGRFNCTNVCGTLRPYKKELNLEFFKHSLNTITRWFVRHDINPKLMNNVMAKIKVPYPPAHEQNAIARFVRIEENKIDLLIGNLNKLNAKLEEYRASLISAAVTGKIDVSDQV